MVPRVAATACELACEAAAVAASDALDAAASRPSICSEDDRGRRGRQQLQRSARASARWRRRARGGATAGSIPGTTSSSRAVRLRRARAAAPPPRARVDRCQHATHICRSARGDSFVDPAPLPGASAPNQHDISMRTLLHQARLAGVCIAVCLCWCTSGQQAQEKLPPPLPDCGHASSAPAGAPARWRCELAAMDSASDADAARGGRRVRWRSYSNNSAPGRARSTAYGGLAARRTLAYFGWEETRGDDWDLLWTGRGQYDFLRQAGLRNEPAAGRRHNHCFPGGLLAGNKRSFVKRHNTMVSLFGGAEFAHVPETFELPYQYGELTERMGEEQAKYEEERKLQAASAAAGAVAATGRPLWILKPTLGARGEGIELLWDTRQVSLSRARPPLSLSLSHSLPLHRCQSAEKTLFSAMSVMPT